MVLKPRRTAIASHAALVLLAVVVVGCGRSPAVSATPTATSTVVAHPPPTEPPPSVTATPSGITATVLAVTEAPAEAVEVDMELPYFDPKEITAAGGSVSFFLTSAKGANHNMMIGPALLERWASSGNVRSGESVLFSVQGLPPGTYTYWCNVDKHYEFGMVGTLTITE